MAARTASPERVPPGPGRPDAAGLGFVVGYKLVKGAAQVLVGLSLLILPRAALTDELRAFALTLRHHATEAWSIAVAGRLLRATTARHLIVVAVAILLDGLFSLVEGWALHRRFRWSRWLIVGATSCLLPFEIVAIFRHPGLGRIALFVVNLLMIAYLARTTVGGPASPRRRA